MNIACIIPAAGKGKRFGDELPKQFHYIQDKTVLEHALQSLADGLIKSGITNFHAIIACNPEWNEKIDSIVASTPFAHSYSIIQGGNERYESIQNAFDSKYARESDFVMIHDAARPFIPYNIIQELMEAVQRTNAVIPILPITDTIKYIDNNGYIEKTIDRTFVKAALTPQVFSTELYQSALEVNASSISITDDASLFELMHYPVATIVGSEIQFKITNKQDLALATLLADSFYTNNV